MKIVFLGTVDFSYHCLEQIIKNNGKVVGVLTKKESEFNSDYKDLTPLTKKHDIPVYYINQINSDESFKILKELNPDIIFCCGWSQIIKERLLNLPKLGIVGVHPSKLPNNRGRHPLIWSLALGLEKSALTFFKMDEGTDTGDIISQEEFSIEYNDDASILYEKIKELASKQIEELLPKLEIGSIEYRSQKKEFGNHWRKRSEVDGKIDWRMSSRAIYNLVRALTHPYVGAHCLYQGEKVKIWKVEEKRGYPKNIEPGKVLKSNENTFIVKTYDNAIELIDHELENTPKEGEYLKW